MGVKPGHDGALAVIEDRRLLLSLEAELAEFCQGHHLDGMVVGEDWYERRREVAAGPQ